ncbi:hypothetical protein MTO96_038892 [Rhipicephalus appendiculatus]
MVEIDSLVLSFSVALIVGRNIQWKERSASSFWQVFVPCVFATKAMDIAPHMIIASWLREYELFAIKVTWK